MNCGFSNLDFLKKQVLAKTMTSDKRFDIFIGAIGLGVAGQFAAFCNRSFSRVVNDQKIISADRVEFCLSRYPVESVSLVEMKLTEKDGWQQVDAPPWAILQTIDQAAGIVRFPEDDDLGPYYAQVRITYTGGYFWEQLDPDEAGYPTAMPAGAFALPDALRIAWLLQCKHVWANQDKLGTDILASGKVASLRFPEDFAPTVEQILGSFKRLQLV